MAEAMKEITEMIKSMVMELILGQMGESISENGKMIKDTEEERMWLIANFQKKAFGKKINALSGYKTDKFDLFYLKIKCEERYKKNLYEIKTYKYTFKTRSLLLYDIKFW